MKAIIVADKNEKVKLPFKKIKEDKIGTFKFSIFEGDVILVQSGIGLVNAGAAAQTLILNYEIEEVFNYGAVGGSKDVNLFDVILPHRIYFHDVITPWYKRGQTPGEKEYYCFDHKGANLASGSSFVDSEERMEDVQRDIPVDIFDMEAAAIAQVCDKNKIKFTCVKAVSDIIGTDVKDVEIINGQIKKAGKLAFKKLLSLL